MRAGLVTIAGIISISALLSGPSVALAAGSCSCTGRIDLGGTPTAFSKCIPNSRPATSTDCIREFSDSYVSTLGAPLLGGSLNCQPSSSDNCGATDSVSAEPSDFQFSPVQAKLQIPIPNFRFSDISVKKLGGGVQVVDIPWIGEYLAAIYRWAVPAGAILAVIIIMIGGVIWLTSAGAERLSTAKTWITNAVIGLLLLVCSYVILNLINPDLARFKSLQVRIITPIEYEDGGDGGGVVTADPAALAKIGIDCPGSGGATAIPTIIGSMAGKVAYRFGGKGGPPPYQEQPNGPYAKYNASCPNENICLDCSGFIDFVYRCAGLSPFNTGTSGIFSGAKEIKEIDYTRNTVDGVALKSGDLLGWRQGEGGKATGHVIVYIGGGMVAESRGGPLGRAGGSNPAVNQLSKFNGTYPFTRIRRL